MAEIQPFRAYRYDTTKVQLDQVLTQPYDKISPAMQDKYYAASPDNLIVIEKGRSFPTDTPDNNVYTRAGAKVQEWLKNGILVQGQDADHHHLFAGISGAGHADEKNARGIHRAWPRGGLRRESRLPP